ncbi:uncharacterized protein LOC135830450 [Sycon ciliatum]|uniref:uncharacterized protein LOC135830450 n=1 Tax=Sycon ciliatum TaxID=27933 RepID=UPI0020AAE5C1|eukprot:scpid95981/ scgid15781/ 
MYRTLCLLALAACAFAQQPSRPVIPEEFTATITFQSHELNETYDGEGRWAHDQAGNRAVQEFEVRNTAHKDRPLHEVRLFRFDLKMEYEVEGPANSSKCAKRPLNGTLESAFGWVAKADYAGKHEIRHHEFDFWSYHDGGITVEMGVDPEMPNQPAFLARRGTHEDSFYDFHEFKAGTPEAEAFSIPKECQ